jgi:hypothetical protein
MMRDFDETADPEAWPDERLKLLFVCAHHKLQRRSAVVVYLPVSRMIHQAVARGRQKPSLRILWYAVARPCGQCGQERVCQRIFSARDIVRAHCEQRDEASIRFARNCLDLAVRLLISSGIHQ